AAQGNSVTGTAYGGIRVVGYTNGITVRRNQITANEFGLYLISNGTIPALVADNSVTANQGVLVQDSYATIVRNTLNVNSTGVNIDLAVVTIGGATAADGNSISGSGY